MFVGLVMEFLVGLIAIGILVGLLVRNRGDNTMDTLGKGCLTLIIIAFAISIALYYLFNFQA
tara:strand:- start:1050 stop:1235 length:186 start_codon:yes stop_codon:yes gene_type:complete